MSSEAPETRRAHVARLAFRIALGREDLSSFPEAELLEAREFALGLGVVLVESVEDAPR